MFKLVGKKLILARRAQIRALKRRHFSELSRASCEIGITCHSLSRDESTRVISLVNVICRISNHSELAIHLLDSNPSVRALAQIKSEFLYKLHSIRKD
jgi:hypothetical protein